MQSILLNIMCWMWLIAIFLLIIQSKKKKSKEEYWLELGEFCEAKQFGFFIIR